MKHPKKPYSIEVCDTPKWINLYVAANEDVALMIPILGTAPSVRNSIAHKLCCFSYLQLIPMLCFPCVVDILTAAVNYKLPQPTIPLPTAL